MAKKKHQSKKHRFKYAEPTSAPVEAQAEPQVLAQTQNGLRPAAVAAGSSAAVVTAGGRDFSYVMVDLRRLGVFAAGLISLELILWYVFGHTGLGEMVYNLVRV